MAYDIFETRTMLKAIEQMYIPKTFLLDTFFRNEQVFTTEYVDIDIIKGKRRLAPFVSPRAQGKVVEKTGYYARSFKPPYIKVKMPTTVEDLLKRQPGQTIYEGGKTPAEVAAAEVGKNLLELIQMIQRREEWMAAQALTTGKITITGDGVDAEIDFLMANDHKVTLSGTAKWTDSASDPVKNLRTWKRKIAQDSGVTADVAVMGSAVIDAFLAHEKVQKALDNRRIVLGQIDPRELPSGATYWGNVANIDIYSYDEWFVDDTGTEQPMVPENTLILGSTKAITARLYGAIRDLKSTAAVRYFPKSWEEEDPSVRWIMVQSAPIVAPLQIDAFMSIVAV